MSLTPELWRWEASKLAAAIRAKDISSREAVQSCLDRIARVNPTTNAMVEVHEVTALEAADAADRAVSRGEALGSLHGVPVTTKVNVNQAGSATTNGVTAFANNIAEEDSPVIANLRRSGAILLGRTNVPAFSWRWFTENDLHGRTYNPWQAELGCGGSSGGAAVAVAVGMGPISHGSDLAGSIRYPAYACGVFGMRPTLGRIPQYDGPGAPERPLLSQLFVAQGPLARSVSDIRLGLKAMVGFDRRDPWSTPAPISFAPTQPCRVAVCRSLPGQQVHASVHQALNVASRALELAGYQIDEVEPPQLGAVADLFSGAVCEAQGGLLQRIQELGDSAIKQVTKSLTALSTPHDMASYMHLLARRSSLLREWEIFFQEHPLLVMPVSWSAPAVHNFDLQGDAAYAQLLQDLAPTIAVNALGLPALAVPTGLSDGVPTGVQLVAARFDEARCLTAGEAIERECPMPTPIEPVKIT